MTWKMTIDKAKDIVANAPQLDEELVRGINLLLDDGRMTITRGYYAGNFLKLNGILIGDFGSGYGGPFVRIETGHHKYLIRRAAQKHAPAEDAKHIALIPTKASDLYDVYGVDIMTAATYDENGDVDNDAQPVMWVPLRPFNQVTDLDGEVYHETLTTYDAVRLAQEALAHNGWRIVGEPLDLGDHVSVDIER